MSVQDEFDYTVGTLVSLAEQLELGKPVRITIDPQDSGELPYQISIAEEELPFAGRAFIDRGSED